MSGLSEFMVFELLDNGERQERDIQKEEIGGVFKPDQVYVIVDEPLRRIFIWKGATSPVRKRFISSRVAQDLQGELQKDAGFHRCKIISVEQGDELSEFLKSYNLESMEVKEHLEDLRYVRNVEKDGKVQGYVIDTIPTEKGSGDAYVSPALGAFDQSKIEKAMDSPDIEMAAPVTVAPSSMGVKFPVKTSSLSDDMINKILDTIVNNPEPEGFCRQNIIIGNYLYGTISKVSSVLGKQIEEIAWERIKKVPKGVIDLDNHKIRVYFDDTRKIVRGVEILVLEGDPKKPVKKEAKPIKKEEKPILEDKPKMPAKPASKPAPEEKPKEVEDDGESLIKEYKQEFPNRKALNVKGDETRNFQAWVTIQAAKHDKEKSDKPAEIKISGRTLPKIPKGDD